MTAIIMRRAAASDLPAIVALLADDPLGQGRESAGGSLDPEYRDAFAALDASPDQLLAVAELDGAVVGTMQLSFLPGLSHKGAWRGLIEAVRVAAPLRSQGLGAEMIAWALDRFRERGCRIAQLTTHKSREKAHRFYDRLGFKQSHYGYKLEL